LRSSQALDTGAEANFAHGFARGGRETGPHDLPPLVSLLRKQQGPAARRNDWGRHVRVRTLAWLLPLSFLLLDVPACAGTLIAVAVPTNPAKREIADAIRRGAEQAALAIGPASGPLGDLTVRIFEAGCTAREGQAAAEAIIQSRPAIVVGHPCARSAVAAAAHYAKAGIPFFAIAVRHPELTARRGGPFVYRLAGRDDRQGLEAAAYLARTFPDQPVVMVHDRTMAARVLAETAARAYADLTRRSAKVIGIVTGGKDYASLVAEVLSTDAPAIFFTGYPAEGSIILTSLRREGWRGTFLGHDALATVEFAPDGPERENGALALQPDDPLDPERATAGAIEAWAGARVEAGTAEPAPIAAMLSRGVTTSSAGLLAFDEQGDLVGRSYRIRKFENGSWLTMP